MDFLINRGILTKYKGEDKNPIIPFGVTVIGENAFRESDIESVSISNSVTTIKQLAFGNCNSLTSVIMPGSITEIGENAFYGCISLKKVHISDIAGWCNIRLLQ